MGNSVISAGLTFGLGKIFGKHIDQSKRKLSRLFSNNNAISYDASFKMVVTKLKNGNAKAFSWKTIRNGTVAQMTDSYMENITNGYIDAFNELNQEKAYVKIDYSKFVNFQY